LLWRKRQGEATRPLQAEESIKNRCSTFLSTKNGEKEAKGSGIPLQNDAPRGHNNLAKVDESRENANQTMKPPWLNREDSLDEKPREKNQGDRHSSKRMALPAACKRKKKKKPFCVSTQMQPPR
jgi:hypothetical protein